MLLFMFVWLSGWAMFEVAALGLLFHINTGLFGNPSTSGWGLGGMIFLLFWLVMWTVGGAFIFSTVTWQLFGREIIAIKTDELIYRVQVLGIGRTRIFATNQIARMRAIGPGSRILSRRSSWWRTPSLSGRGVGSVAFDYGARACRIGASLDRDEARLLIQQMKRWLPEGAVAS